MVTMQRHRLNLIHYDLCKGVLDIATRYTTLSVRDYSRSVYKINNDALSDVNETWTSL